MCRITITLARLFLFSHMCSLPLFLSDCECCTVTFLLFGSPCLSSIFLVYTWIKFSRGVTFKSQASLVDTSCIPSPQRVKVKKYN